MAILFAGTPDNAAVTLREIVAAGTPIALVLTRPDAPVGRKGVMTPSPVAGVAAELGIPCIKTHVVGAGELETFAKHGIDFAIVVAFGVLLKADALAALSKGWFNLHYSLLPKWRGAAPVQRALINGDRETGVSLFRIDEGLDTGDIVAEVPTEIQANEDSGQLLTRLTHLGITLLLEQLPAIEAGLVTLCQQDNALATLAPKLSRRDGRLFFSNDASKLECQVKGVTPEPGAWFDSTVGQVKVIKAMAAQVEVPRDELILANSLVYVGTGKDSLQLIEVQPAGKKPMRASDWFRGLRVTVVKVVNE